MNYFQITVLFVLIAGILVTPVYLLSYYEGKSKKNLYYLHIGGNALFMVWSIYDLNYGYHYAHGPNTLFLIIPAWPGLMLFYGFYYPRMLKNKLSTILGRSIAGLYLVGCVVGIITEISN